ncbi:MAG: acetyl-CoA synthetase [Spartobacteria bacterium]|nr:acetyl-CoA synthetase [Spartobacteria bacterium]
MNVLSRFVNRTTFESYQDFHDHLRIEAPEAFNFAYDVVDVYAAEAPEKRALVWCNDQDEERVFTFADIKRHSDKTANALRAMGIGKGDRALLILKGRYQFWITLLALHRIGAVAVPATHMLTYADLVYRIEQANLKMVVCIPDERLLTELDRAQKKTGDILTLKAVVDQAVPPDGWIDFDGAVEAAASTFDRPVGDEGPTNHDLSLLYFSSGTTGLPKMVGHDFIYPLGHILTAGFWQCVQDDGLHYTVADTGWAKCVWGKIYGQWICGSAVFAYDYEKFDAGVMLDKCVRYGVSTFCAPPTVYRLLIRKDLSMYDLSHLRYAVTAGEPLNPEVYERFRKQTGLRLMEGYGQTELVVTVATWPWNEPKPGSMGLPAPGYDVCILHPDGTPCDAGEEGEICVRTAGARPPGMFTAYHNDAELTARAWHDGIYHTGDMAWRDEDNYLWFIGRDDDIIKSSGYKIGPFEVESILMKHPAVLECAVTGTPDPVRGQAVKATIVLTDGYVAGDELKQELQHHVKKMTAPYKYPRFIEFVETLPKTISGKIRRVEIRAHG